jgi:succinyl-CoA synthetase beta subunit
MAKLFEYQAKKLMSEVGIQVPAGQVAQSPEQAREIAARMDKPVVLKAQAWVTGRAEAGGVRFADTPEDALVAAKDMLGMDLKGFKVQELLVEEKLDIAREFFVGLIIDDEAQSPSIVFSSVGGSGIEEISKEQPEKITRTIIDAAKGLTPHQARNMLVDLGVRGKLQNLLTGFLVKFYKMCQGCETRSAEINPLVLTADGRIMAADSHTVIDDYAVFRHPELGIEIAREFDRPATELEKVAYQVETKDHRGTFYFFQMPTKADSAETYVAFHGAGGGGSMMSMDALLGQGFQIANFCDTSGNPSASKVYRAAKIILSQKHLSAYFASGSGVASQEQFHSARGLVKAFREFGLAMPAVIRIGGNAEEEAMQILEKYTQDLPCVLEAYGRDTPASHCAVRLRALVDAWDPATRSAPTGRSNPGPGAYGFETVTGQVLIDHQKCASCQDKPCIAACDQEVLRLEEGEPVLALTPEEAKKGRCTECLACEIACEFEGEKGLCIDLPIPGLSEALREGA